MPGLPAAPTASAYHLFKHDRQLHNTIQELLMGHKNSVPGMRFAFQLCSKDHQGLALQILDHIRSCLPLREPELKLYQQAVLDMICSKQAPDEPSLEIQFQRASEIVECFEHVIHVGASLSGITGDHVRRYVESKGPVSKLFPDFHRESLIIDDMVRSPDSPARHILVDKVLDARLFPKEAGHYMILVVGGPDEPDFFATYVGQARNLFDRLKKHWDRNHHYARKRQEAIDQGLPPPYARQMLYNSWNYGERFVRFAPLHRSYNYVGTDDVNTDKLPQTWQSIVESVYAVFFRSVQREYLEKYHPSPAVDSDTVGLNVQFPLFQQETFNGKFNGGFAALKNNPDPAVQAVYAHHITMFTKSGREAMEAYGWKSLAEAIWGAKGRDDIFDLGSEPVLVCCNNCGFRRWDVVAKYCKITGGFQSRQLTCYGKCFDQARQTYRRAHNLTAETDVTGAQVYRKHVRYFSPVDFAGVPRVNAQKAKNGSPVLKTCPGLYMAKWKPENDDYRLQQENVIPLLPIVPAWGVVRREDLSDPRHIAIFDAGQSTSVPAPMPGFLDLTTYKDGDGNAATVAAASCLPAPPNPTTSSSSSDVDISMDASSSTDIQVSAAEESENGSPDTISEPSSSKLVVKRDSGHSRRLAHGVSKAKKMKKKSPVQSSRITDFFAKSS